MKTKFLLLLIGLLVVVVFFSGCVQQGLGEMGTCLGKCTEACNLLKDKNFSFEGYTQLQLEKNTGGLSVNCSCPCT